MTAKNQPYLESVVQAPIPFWFQGLYSVAYAFFCLIYLPHFLLRTKRAENPGRVIRERFASYAPEKLKALEGRKVIWIHAVSVGEVMASRVFIEQILVQDPKLGIVLTTVTPTGQSIAKTYENDRLSAVYMPFDFPSTVQKFLKTFRPSMLLLMETELWPQALIEAQSQGIPVGMINARLSEKSVRRYKQFSWFFKSIFDCLNFVLAQTSEDAERFKQAGVSEAKIQVMGNMKFDTISLETIPQELLQMYRTEWKLTEQNKIWVVGSTHPGEEEIIFRIFKSLKKNHPHLKCILAPRHIERSLEIKKQAESVGLTVSLSSRHCEKRSDEAISNKKRKIASPSARNDEASFWDILIVNELGILKQIYGLADVVYVGGSLVSHGGQNPIEPAALKKPILHGPYIFNFKLIYGELDANQGAILIRDEKSLNHQLEMLLTYPNTCRQLGENAFRIVRQAQGASQRHVEWVSNFLTSSELTPSTDRHPRNVLSGI